MYLERRIAVQLVILKLDFDNGRLPLFRYIADPLERQRIRIGFFFEILCQLLLFLFLDIFIRRTVLEFPCLNPVFHPIIHCLNHSRFQKLDESLGQSLCRIIHSIVLHGNCNHIIKCIGNHTFRINMAAERVPIMIFH